MNEYMDYINERLRKSADLKHRELSCNQGVIHMFFIDNLCDSKYISEYIIQPFLIKDCIPSDIELIKKDILYSASAEDIKAKEETLIHILSGDVVILFDFIDGAIYCEAKGFSKRSITTPITEAGIKGPREGFSEVIADNISLLRRRIKNPDLTLESARIGEKSNTVVMIVYIKDVAPDSLINRVNEKLNNINIEFILDINYIEEQLRRKGTVFDTVGYTEKPDVAASKILEGKVAVIVDGTPFVLTVPYFFIENFQAADDYYLNKDFTNTTRLLRVLAFSMAVLLPGFYIALASHHFALIPIAYIFRLASSRADVPFPLILEVLIMLFFFQLLREAGIRLPQPIGQAMSIVGALILGDAAVGSGLASQTTVIVVALSSISSFLIPKLYNILYLWSSLVILLSSLLGLMGFFASFFLLIAHIASLDSCGYPYFMPLTTSNEIRYKDLVLRKALKDVSDNILNKDDKK